ncbi:MAG TPA: thiamine phosphate synthase, partial [Limnochordia bacterium]
AAGAAGVCVAAAVLLADDPGAAADALRRVVASYAVDGAETTPRPASDPSLSGAGAAIVPTARPHRRTPADPHTRPHLQVVADPRAVADWPAFAAAVAAGGADSLQIRAPGAGGGELLGWAEAALRAAPYLGVIVGERADVARMAGASGVQLPERGLPVGRARRAWAGLRWGRSVHDVEGAMRAGTEGADWLVFGHVFPTDSKPDQPARGVRMLAEVVASVSIPVLAIGGIRAGNAAAVIQAGAAGVAVMGAATRAQDPRGATAAIRAALDGAGPARPAEEGASCASI